MTHLLVAYTLLEASSLLTNKNPSTVEGSMSQGKTYRSPGVNVVPILPMNEYNTEMQTHPLNDQGLAFLSMVMIRRCSKIYLKKMTPKYNYNLQGIGVPFSCQIIVLG